jgi:S1-C subfamily serine protease/cell division septation protein DedD
MSEQKFAIAIPAFRRLATLLVAATFIAAPPMALAGGLNWKGAAAGAGQGMSDWAERESELEQQKKLIEYQYELEKQRLQQQAALEQRRQQQALEQKKAAEETARRAAEEAKRNALSTGTGFFVTGDGYLVTNYHVISDKNTYAVRDSKGRYYRANVIARDQTRDLALLKVEGRFPALKIGHSDSVTKGQRVMAVGYPQISIQGNESKVTDGIINSLSGIRNDDDWFQISVPIQGGNSGGPLVSESGTVYGVVVATLNASKILESTGNLPQNVNYAIKSKLVLDFLAREGVKNVPTFSGKASIAGVDSASVLIIAKNGPIDVAYQSAPIDRAAEARLAQQAAATEKLRLAEESNRVKEAATAEKLRLAEAAKQAQKTVVAENARLAGQGAPPDAAPAKSGEFVILIGAFANEENVRNLRAKLAEKNVKTYVEALVTPGGKKTQVRAGPFENREATEMALENMKQVGVSGIIASK